MRTKGHDEREIVSVGPNPCIRDAAFLLVAVKFSYPNDATSDMTESHTPPQNARTVQ